MLLNETVAKGAKNKNVQGAEYNLVIAMPRLNLSMARNVLGVVKEYLGDCTEGLLSFPP